MALEIVPQSHLDHGLAQEHVSFILERFATRSEFFRETIALPFWLAPLTCGLHGPIVGDVPVPESEAVYIVRGNRKHMSRMVNRPKRETRILTVIGGHMPVKEGNGFGAVDATRCVLYTAFGGPSAPRERANAFTRCQKRRARGAALCGFRPTESGSLAARRSDHERKLYVQSRMARER